jgi:hypothetical protein
MFRRDLVGQGLAMLSQRSPKDDLESIIVIYTSHLRLARKEHALHVGAVDDAR